MAMMMMMMTMTMQSRAIVTPLNLFCTPRLPIDDAAASTLCHWRRYPL